ncbi:MAG TPA: hypothetical protein VF158_08150 [Longimicrobiales bacterium]
MATRLDPRIARLQERLGAGAPPDPRVAELQRRRNERVTRMVLDTPLDPVAADAAAVALPEPRPTLTPDAFEGARIVTESIGQAVPTFQVPGPRLPSAPPVAAEEDPGFLGTLADVGRQVGGAIVDRSLATGRSLARIVERALPDVAEAGREIAGQEQPGSEILRRRQEEVREIVGPAETLPGQIAGTGTAIVFEGAKALAGGGAVRGALGLRPAATALGRVAQEALAFVPVDVATTAAGPDESVAGTIAALTGNETAAEIAENPVTRAAAEIAAGAVGDVILRGAGAAARAGGRRLGGLIDVSGEVAAGIDEAVRPMGGAARQAPAEAAAGRLARLRAAAQDQPTAEAAPETARERVTPGDMAPETAEGVADEAAEGRQAARAVVRAEPRPAGAVDDPRSAMADVARQIRRVMAGRSEFAERLEMSADKPQVVGTEGEFTIFEHGGRFAVARPEGRGFFVEAGGLESEDAAREAARGMGGAEGAPAAPEAPRAVAPEPEPTTPAAPAAREAAAPAEGLPIRVSPDDIDFDMARRAHEGSSMSPERRAHQEQQAYVEHIQSVYDQLAPLAKTDEQKRILAVELEQYRDGYLRRVRDVLAARSRTLNPMVTGRANFPTARNQKALATEQRRVEELRDFTERAQSAIRKKLRPGSGPISSDDPSAPETLRKKIAEREAMQERMKAANRIVRRKNLSDAEKRALMISDAGLSERLADAALKPDDFGRVGFPDFMLRNNLSEIKRLRGRLESIEASRADDTAETPFDGGTIIDNVESNRLQIVFDGKPDEAMRAKLKARGFRWAPSVGAWQRQRSPAANQAVREILGVRVGEAPAPRSEPTPAPTTPTDPRIAALQERVQGREAEPAAPETVVRAEAAKVPAGHPGGFFDLRAVQAVRGAIRRNFTSAGDLPRPVFERKIKRDGWINSQLRQAAFTRRDFERAAKEAFGGARKLSPKQVRAVNDVLGGRAAPETIPEVLRPVVARMRAELDALSRRMIDSGVVEGELAAKVDANMGVYLTRSYRVFDDPQWAEKVPADVRNKAKALLRSEFPEASEAEIEGQINELLFRGERDRPIGPVAALARGSKLGSKNLSILQKRKDIPPEIRALWGEYEDPLVNYVRSVQKMAHLIGNHEFLTDVRQAHQGQIVMGAAEAREDAFLFDRPVTRGEQSFHARFAAEGSQALAPLNGLYTTPEIRRAFEQAVEVEAVPDWLRLYMKVNGTVKFSKTVGSLMTHIRNMVGNTSFAVANGHWRLAKAGGAWKATLTSLAKLPAPEWRSYYRRALELGVVDESARAGELQDVIRDASKIDPREFTEGMIERGGRRALSAITDLYRAEDDVWKLYAWENEVARYSRALGVPRAEAEEIAARIVRDTYPTYSLVPRFVKNLRRFPLVGSFVSFPAEVVRTLTNTLELTARELKDPRLRTIGAERLAGLMVAAAAVPTASMASRWVLGMTRGDDEDVRRFLPHWSENSSLLYLGREDGKVRFIDLSYTDPYSYVRKPLIAFLRGDDWRTATLQAGVEAMKPFVGEEILAEKLIDVARNQRRGGGRIYNPQAPIDQQAADVLAHVWEAVEPGTLSSARRIAMGLTGKTTIHGRSYDPALESLAVFTGHRLQELDVAQALSFKGREFEREMRDATRVLSAVASRRGTVTPDEIREAYIEMEHSRKRLIEEAHEDAVAAARLGLTPQRIQAILAGSGLSSDDLAMVFAGQWEPYRPSSRFLAGVARSVESLAGPGERGQGTRTFAERRALIQRLAAEVARDGLPEREFRIPGGKRPALAEPRRR